MKLLLLNFEFPPLGTGGGRQSMALATELAKTNDIYFLTAGFKNFGQSWQNGFLLHRLKTGRKQTWRSTYCDMFSYVYHAWHALPGVVRRFNPAAVLVFYTVPTGFLTFHPAIKRLPFVISVLGSDVPGHNPDRFKFVYQLNIPLVKNIWKRAGAVVCNSQDLRQEVQAFGLKNEIVVIPNGIDLNRFRPTSRNALTGIRLLYVGRLIPLKRIDKVIEVIPVLQRLTKQEVSFTVVGTGVEEERLKRQVAKLKIEDRVVFRGEVKYSQITREFAAANVYIQLSRREGMSNSVVEALASGLPVVTTPVGGISDLSQVGGLVVVHDFARLAQCIIAALGQKPSPAAIAAFGFSHRAHQYDMVLKRLARMKV